LMARVKLFHGTVLYGRVRAEYPLLSDDLGPFTQSLSRAKREALSPFHLQLPELKLDAPDPLRLM